MKSIPQLHDGILYRSRTEARWAEFFTLAGLPFEYEPEGFDIGGEWYVPDFRVGAIYFEVKGAEPTERETRVASGLCLASQSPVVVAVGNPGSCRMRAFLPPAAESSDCTIVEEFRSDDGAWLAQFAEGGGWAFPLRGDLVNCSATGGDHPLMAEAGRLQFRKPRVTGEAQDIGSVVSGIISRIASGRLAP